MNHDRRAASERWSIVFSFNVSVFLSQLTSTQSFPLTSMIDAGVSARASPTYIHTHGSGSGILQYLV